MPRQNYTIPAMCKCNRLRKHRRVFKLMINNFHILFFQWIESYFLLDHTLQLVPEKTQDLSVWPKQLILLVSKLHQDHDKTYAPFQHLRLEALLFFKITKKSPVLIFIQIPTKRPLKNTKTTSWIWSLPIPWISTWKI